MQLHLILILVAGICTCHSKPAFSRSKKAEEQSVTSEPANNPLDLGVLESCSTPYEGQMGVCSKLVNYPVPSTLLNPLTISNTLLYINSAHSEIYASKPVNGYDPAECAEAQLKYLCGLYFPKCEQSADLLQAEFSFGSCNQDIEDKCEPSARSALLAGGVCYVNSTTVPAAKCKPSSEYELKSAEIFCSSVVAGWTDVYLTDVMYVQLQQVEKSIESVWTDFSAYYTSSSSAEKCTQAYARMACQSVGRCWDQGKKAEITATREDCELFVGCGNWMTGFNCSNFPPENTIPLTPATPITNLATIARSTTDMPYIAFEVDGENRSSSLRSSSLIGLLLLSVLMAAVLL